MNFQSTKRQTNPFLEVEAEFSDGEGVSSDEADDSDQELYDASFINDGTQLSQDQTHGKPANSVFRHEPCVVAQEWFDFGYTVQ